MIKICTKGGDSGMTKLADGSQVKKTSAIIELFGNLDELNSFLGWAHGALDGVRGFSSMSRLIFRIQQEIFTIANLLIPHPAAASNIEADVDMDALIYGLEDNIETFGAKLSSPVKSFVLPGGGEIASRLHIGRVVCRRAERVCFLVIETETKTALLEKAGKIAVYLNRLSDLLYVLAYVAATVKQ